MMNWMGIGRKQSCCNVAVISAHRQSQGRRLDPGEVLALDAAYVLDPPEC
jgi:hypothetical protein